VLELLTQQEQLYLATVTQHIKWQRVSPCHERVLLTAERRQGTKSKEPLTKTTFLLFHVVDVDTVGWRSGGQFSNDLAVGADGICGTQSSPKVVGRCTRTHDNNSIF